MNSSSEKEQREGAVIQLCLTVVRIDHAHKISGFADSHTNQSVLRRVVLIGMIILTGMSPS